MKLQGWSHRQFDRLDSHGIYDIWKQGTKFSFSTLGETVCTVLLKSFGQKISSKQTFVKFRKIIYVKAT